jgi:hypothetical protein
MQISHAILIGSVVIAVAIIFERPITQPIVERTSAVEKTRFLGCMNEGCLFSGKIKGLSEMTLLTTQGEVEIAFPLRQQDPLTTSRPFVEFDDATKNRFREMDR